MALHTKQEHIESLRKQRPKGYMAREEIKNLLDHLR